MYDNYCIIYIAIWIQSVDTIDCLRAEKKRVKIVQGNNSSNMVSFPGYGDVRQNRYAAWKREKFQDDDILANILLTVCLGA